MAPGYQIVWSFRPRPDRVAEFERVYGPGGYWARFFQTGEGYLGTELYRAVGAELRYVTIDRWASRAAFEVFRRARAAEYAELDARCEALTATEERIGSMGEE